MASGWGAVRAKLACDDAMRMGSAGATLTLNSKSVRIFTAPTLMTLVRGTTVGTMGPMLPRNSAAINTVVRASRLGPSNLGRRIATATRLARVRNQGLAFGIDTSSDGKLIKRNARVHCVISERHFLDGLWRRAVICREFVSERLRRQ